MEKSVCILIVFIDCGFKQFETTDYEKISNLLNYLNYIETML